MRLFGYYAFHSVVNQIRKLLKTWVLVFIVVCGLLGGLIGFTAASLGTASEDDVEYSMEMEEVEEDFEYEEELEDVLISTDSINVESSEEGFIVSYSDGSASTVTRSQVFELICLLLILGMLIYNILSADKNGSKIFLPADVNLLFASPMKPQSVLLFRLMCQVGMAVFASMYILFNLPTMMHDLELSLPVILGVILAWVLLLVTCRLVQVFFYTLCSTKANLKKYLTPGVWGFVVLLLGIMYIYSGSRGTHYIPTFIAILTSPWTRWIPFVGWLKGYVVYLIAGEYQMALLLLALIIIGLGLLVWGIWNMKADFYEDAMAKSEEMAALMASAEENGSLVAQKKKNHSKRIRRNEFKHGQGANVFFFKSMYNRFRFAPLGIFTKTAVTYFGVAIAGFLIGNLFESKQPFMVIAILVGIVVFFRAMGNPLEEDTRMPLFSMIPENTWLKLFWSVLAGSVNCLLDLLPAMIVGAVLTGVNPLIVPGYIALILSVDLYATIVGTFISLSVPESIGKLPKQMIQIFFVYFGLIPDAICIGVGFASDHPSIGLFGSAGINLLLGAIFFLLTPLFLEPKGGARKWASPLTEEERRSTGRSFSKIGMASFTVLVVASVIQIVLGLAAYQIRPELRESTIATYLMTFLPINLVAFPLGFLMLRNMKTERPKSRNLTALEMVRYISYSFSAMYIGNLIGSAVNLLIGLFTTEEAGNPIAALATMSDSVPMKLIFLVIAAPVMEELFFRKFLIDRMRKYGEKTALITTALMFGLFHGNFSQFFYATILGMVFAYVYLQTGKIRYTIALHMGVNFMGSIFAPFLLEQISGDLLNVTADALSEISSSPWIYVLLVYSVIMLINAVVGVLMLCIRAEKIQFRDVTSELAKGQIFKTVWVNPGMILFFLGCALLFVMNL